MPKNVILPQKTFIEKSKAPFSRVWVTSHQAIQSIKNVRGIAPGAGRRIHTIQAIATASIAPIINASTNGGKLNVIFFPGCHAIIMLSAIYFPAL